MMKMKFSFKGVFKAASMASLMLAFLFSGNLLNAQTLQTSADLPSDVELLKVYGDNFSDKGTASISTKNAIEAILNTNTSNTQQEAERSVEVFFANELLNALGQSADVSAALKVAFAKAYERKANYNVIVDLNPIYTKYYALLTI